jgi:hypothetical protein
MDLLPNIGYSPLKMSEWSNPTLPIIVSKYRPDGQRCKIRTLHRKGDNGPVLEVAQPFNDPKICLAGINRQGSNLAMPCMAQFTHLTAI